MTNASQRVTDTVIRCQTCRHKGDVIEEDGRRIMICENTNCADYLLGVEIEDAHVRRKFRFHWKDGRKTDASGKNVAEAFLALGYGGGAFRALDYYEDITSTMKLCDEGDK